MSPLLYLIVITFWPKLLFHIMAAKIGKVNFHYFSYSTWFPVWYFPLSLHVSCDYLGLLFQYNPPSSSNLKSSSKTRQKCWNTSSLKEDRKPSQRLITPPCLCISLIIPRRRILLPTMDLVMKDTIVMRLIAPRKSFSHLCSNINAWWLIRGL